MVDKILEHLDCSLITHDETPIVNKKVVIENRVAYRISLKHETQPIEGERGLPDELQRVVGTKEGSLSDRFGQGGCFGQSRCK